MFKLGKHVRKGVQLAAVGAAATVPFAGSGAEAADLTWDSGVNNTFDNATANFSGSTATANDDVHFGVAGNHSVDPAAGGVSVRTLSIEDNGYTFNNTGLITTTAAIYGTPTAVVKLTTGNGTISAPLKLEINQTGTVGQIDVANGSQLTTGNVTFGAYGVLEKTGGGTLLIGGALTTSNGSTNYGLKVTAGTLRLSGNNVVGGQQPVSVALGATLGSSGSNVSILDPAASTFTVNGSIAPNGSSTGRLSITSALYSNAPHITVTSTGSLDFDLVSPGTNDVLNVTSGEYASSLTFQDGSELNLTGPFSAGTYTILTLSRSTSQNRAAAFDFSTNVGTTNDGIGLDIGSAPLGFTYTFAAHPAEGGNPLDVYGGIDLIVEAAIPEPGTLSLLGIGALGLLSRRRRK